MNLATSKQVYDAGYAIRLYDIYSDDFSFAHYGRTWKLSLEVLKKNNIEVQTKLEFSPFESVVLVSALEAMKLE